MWSTMVNRTGQSKQEKKEEKKRYGTSYILQMEYICYFFDNRVAIVTHKFLGMASYATAQMCNVKSLCVCVIAATESRVCLCVDLRKYLCPSPFIQNKLLLRLHFVARRKRTMIATRPSGVFVFCLAHNSFSPFFSLPFSFFFLFMKKEYRQRANMHGCEAAKNKM